MPSVYVHPIDIKKCKQTLSGRFFFLDNRQTMYHIMPALCAMTTPTSAIQRRLYKLLCLKCKKLADIRHFYDLFKNSALIVDNNKV